MNLIFLRHGLSSVIPDMVPGVPQLGNISTIRTEYLVFQGVNDRNQPIWTRAGALGGLGTLRRPDADR